MRVEGNGGSNYKYNGKSGMRGSLRCGGKSAASGRDNEVF
jgi:hypothetical protein